MDQALPAHPFPPAPSADGEALDAPVQWQSFSRPLAGAQGEWESYLSIQGMHCATCNLAVEDALRPLPGVRAVDVGAGSIARVVWSPQVGRPSQWLEALERAGYGALPAGDMLDSAPRRQAARVTLWRWLVAGFCMMQVMMYAAPAYFAAPGELTAQDQGLLLWASWVLTLPVLLFSSRPFFSGALRDLRNRRVGMDVPVALGILVAFIASSVSTFDPQGVLRGEVWYDSLTMFVFFLLSGRLLEERLRNRTAGALEALLRRVPPMVERQQPDGSFLRVAVGALSAGDTVRVLPGEAFPADGEVLSGTSQVDEALLTGESRPLARQAGDTVVAGSHNLSGPLLVRVRRTGEDTRYAGIVALMERAAMDKPRLAQAADRIAGPFLLLVLLAAGAAALAWWPQGPAHAVGIAMAVLVVTCPCALSLATPAATLAAAGALARHGVLVRRLQALEDCASIDTVVFDKTGTLTEDRMAATLESQRAGTSRATVLALAGALARQSLHPASRAVGLAAQGDAQALYAQEVAGAGVQGRVILDGTLYGARLGSAVFCGVKPSEGASRVHLADAQGWLASFSLHESPRPGAQACISSLRDMGMRVQLLSGDQPAAVARLAWRMGIGDAFGGRTPGGKLAHLRGLQQRGGRVAMVGDGMNDGPVLASADVSVAMGSAVPLAQARSDFIVQSGQPSAIPLLLLQALRTRAVVRQNLAWAALYNALCVPLALAGLLPPWLAGLGMAASSLLVVLNAARLARLPEA